MNVRNIRVLSVAAIASLGLTAPGVASAGLASWFDCVVDAVDAIEFHGGEASNDEFIMAQDICWDLHMVVLGDVDLDDKVWDLLYVDPWLLGGIYTNEQSIYDLQASARDVKVGQAKQDERLDKLEGAAGTDELVAKIEGLESKIADYEKVFAGFQAKIADQAKVIDGLAARIASDGERYDKLAAQVDGLESLVTEISEIRVIAAQLDDTKAKVKQIEDRIAK